MHTGVPVAFKEMMRVKGHPMGYGTRLPAGMEEKIAAEDDPIVQV